MSAALLLCTPWRHNPKPFSLRFLGKEIQWVVTAWYMGVMLDRWLMWNLHIDLVRWKVSQRIGILSPLLHLQRSLLIGNIMLLYKQLIQTLMDCACLVWWHVAPTHLKLLQAIQSKNLHSALGTPWYISNLEIFSDLGVPYIADSWTHQVHCTESWHYASQCGEPFSLATWEVPRLPKRWVKICQNLYKDMEVHSFQPNRPCTCWACSESKYGNLVGHTGYEWWLINKILSRRWDQMEYP